MPKSGMLRFFRSKSGVLWVFHFLPVHHQSLRFSQPRNFADRQYARIHSAASRYVSRHVQVGFLFSLLGPPWCQGVFRLVRSWLFFGSGFWLRLFVARFWLVRLVEVFAVVSTWSVLLSVGLGDTLWSVSVSTLERRQVVRGFRPQAAAASCAHVSCSGGREPVAWVQILGQEIDILVCFKIKARSC